MASTDSSNTNNKEMTDSDYSREIHEDFLDGDEVIVSMEDELGVQDVEELKRREFSIIQQSETEVVLRFEAPESIEASAGPDQTKELASGVTVSHDDPGFDAFVPNSIVEECAGHSAGTVFHDDDAIQSDSIQVQEHVNDVDVVCVVLNPTCRVLVEQVFGSSLEEDADNVPPDGEDVFFLQARGLQPSLQHEEKAYWIRKDAIKIEGHSLVTQFNVQQKIFASVIFRIAWSNPQPEANTPCHELQLCVELVQFGVENCVNAKNRLGRFIHRLVIELQPEACWSRKWPTTVVAFPDNTDPPAVALTTSREFGGELGLPDPRNSKATVRNATTIESRVLPYEWTSSARPNAKEKSVQWSWEIKWWEGCKHKFDHEKPTATLRFGNLPKLPVEPDYIQLSPQNVKAIWVVSPEAADDMPAEGLKFYAKITLHTTSIDQKSIYKRVLRRSCGKFPPESICSQFVTIPGPPVKVRRVKSRCTIV